MKLSADKNKSTEQIVDELIGRGVILPEFRDEAIVNLRNSMSIATRKFIEELAKKSVRVAFLRNLSKLGMAS